MEHTQPSPTKGNLMAAKNSMKLAVNGYDLMDRKRNILVREMMGLIDRANALRDRIDTTYRRAYEALQHANVTLGICESLAKSIPVETGLSVSVRSVMGVELPTVRLDTPEPKPCYDLGSTNSAFDEAYLCFHQVKLMTAELAEVENCVYRLAVAIKKTQSRANALKNIILPELEQTISSISGALEEKEREEFSRLKVIKRAKGQPTADT